MLNPNQLLLQNLGATSLGQPQISPQQMIMEMILNGQSPAKFGKGGEVLGKALGPAVGGYFVYPDAKAAYQAVKTGEHVPEKLGALADTTASVTSLPYFILSSLLKSPEVGAGTLDEPDQPSLSGALAQYLLSLGSNK